METAEGWPKNSHFALQTSHFSRAGVVAARAFVAERLGRVNVTFDDEVGVGQNGFQFGQNVFKARPT